MANYSVLNTCCDTAGQVKYCALLKKRGWPKNSDNLLDALF